MYVRTTIAAALSLCALIAQTKHARAECTAYETYKYLASDGDSFDSAAQAVALCADTAVIGIALDDDSGTDAGAVWILHFDGTTWSEVQKLTPPSGSAYDHYGHAVAIDGSTIVIGTPLDDDLGTNAGAVYVYSYQGSSWTLSGKLLPSDGQANDRFGYSVDIRGERLIVGAIEHDDEADNAGAAYVFRFNGSEWTQEQKLPCPGLGVEDKLGYSVGIDGDVAIASAKYHDPSGVSNAGTVYVCRYNGTSWNYEQKLHAADAASSDYFGHSAAISGGWIVVGAIGNQDAGAMSGSAYVFAYSPISGTWLQQQKLLPPTPNASEWDRFGYSVDIAGGSLLVGADGDDNGILNSGAAYAFGFNGIVWEQQARLLPSDGVSGGKYGLAVAVSGDSGLVGAPNMEDGGYDSGAAYLYRGLLTDCNFNGVLDICDIGVGGSSSDCNGNGIPDECETDLHPTILVQPESTEVCVGDDAIFTLTATGSGTLHYQWTKDGSPVGGDTNILMLPDVLLVDNNAVIACTVTDDCGSIASDTAALLVGVAPTAVAENSGPICEGESVELMGGPDGMDSYYWQGPGEIGLYGQNITIPEAEPGEYCLIVTNGACVSEEACTTVIINPAPVAEASTDGPTCEGEAVQLIGGPDGMNSYEWAGPGGFTSTEQSPLVSPAVAGEYCLTVSIAGCDPDTACTTVNVLPTPIAAASDDGPVCAGENVQLTGQPAGADAYTWSGPEEFASTERNPLVEDALPGEYCLTITVDGCDSEPACTTVEVNGYPTAIVSNDGPACEGDTVQLTGGPDGAEVYAWTGPGGYTSDEQSPSVTDPIPGDYCLVVSVAGCDSDEACTTVEVTPTPVTTAAHDAPVCDNESIQLWGGPDGMDSYSWTGPGGFMSSEQNPLVTEAVAGDYCLEVTFGPCAPAPACTTVELLPAPTATVSNNGPACEGEEVHLVGGPDDMDAYEWTGPLSFISSEQSPVLSSPIPGDYCLTVMKDGCSSTACTNVVVNPAPPPATATNNGPACDGEDVQLSGGPDDMDVYEWTGPGGYTSSEQSPVLSPATPGEYCLAITYDGCDPVTMCTTVEIWPTPVATASNDGPVCEGADVQLTGGPDDMDLYEWTGPGGFTSTEQSPLLSPGVSGEYCLTVTQGNCSSMACTLVVVNAKPTATAANDGPVCDGGDVQLTGGPDGMDSYAWTGPGGFTSTEQSPLLVEAIEGQYCLTVVEEGCEASEACTLVVVHPRPTATITATPDTEVCAGDVVTLDAGAGYNQYLWSTGEATQTIEVILAGDYDVTVMDSKGCQDVATIQITTQTPTTWYRDADGDGYGNPADPLLACEQPADYVDNGLDCNDTIAAVNPGEPEDCTNGVDDDCNGLTDGADPACSTPPTPSTWYRDADGDGYGTPTASVQAVAQPAGFVTNNSDCDDTDYAVNPAATENCTNGIDDDCNGYADDTDPACGGGPPAGQTVTCYRDCDGDGYGDPNQPTTAAGTCPPSYVSDNTDCDDTNAEINPGATEACANGIDDDCNGLIDLADSEQCCCGDGLCGVGTSGMLGTMLLCLFIMKGHGRRRR